MHPISNIQIYKANINRTKRRERLVYDDSNELKYCFSDGTGQTIQRKSTKKQLS